MLVELYSALKAKGNLIIKEPILESAETAPRLCPSGEWLLTRPAEKLEELFKMNFDIVQQVDIRPLSSSGLSRCWYLKKRPLNKEYRGKLGLD